MKFTPKFASLLAGTAALALAAVAAPSLAGDDPSPAAAAAAALNAGKPMFGTWGFDTAGQDTAVKPGDDFNRFASGKWVDATEIPGDKADIGAFRGVFDMSQEQLKAMITKAPASSKYGMLYRAMMDEATVEKAGLGPLKADLATLNAARTKADIARFAGQAGAGRFGMALVDFDVDADTKDPTLNVLYLGQGAIGLPDRDYYLKADFKTQRAAYVAYITRTMKALGNPDPKGAAARIMALETAFATKSWAAEDRRDIDKVNNPMSLAQLSTWAPGFAWGSFFAGAGIAPQGRMIVQEKTAIRDLAAIWAKTPLATLKEWQSFHVANRASPYLNKAMVDSRFQFVKTISGVTVNRPRWQRAVTLVDGSLGELVGEDYVGKYFPPASRAKMEALVGNLKVAMADRIKTNSWMSAATKTAALEKLRRMEVMVGYPDKFRDYSKLTVGASDLYGSVERASKFNAAYRLADLGKPVDKKKWAMNPQTVNAYNGGLQNKIVFPAGILQPPFFDPNADDAVNYGAIGAVIGHEISHGFDDQGRKIDATGAVRDWWTPEDARRFEAESKVFGSQYAKFEAAPGAFVNPSLTMGENIADFAGVQVALDAYHRSLGGKEAPVLGGLTGDQRFFLGFAQVWREKQREDAARSQVTTDPHSPGIFRVIGPLRNVDAWYTAFGIKPGDKLYIAPENRARIW